jgi:hypothetical protein
MFIPFCEGQCKMLHWIIMEPRLIHNNKNIPSIYVFLSLDSNFATGASSMYHMNIFLLKHWKITPTLQSWGDKILIYAKGFHNAETLEHIHETLETGRSHTQQNNVLGISLQFPINCQ